MLSRASKGRYLSVKSLVLMMVVIGVMGDVFLHNPPGTNNRNRERFVGVTNRARLFDSQNNDQGE